MGKGGARRTPNTKPKVTKGDENGLLDTDEDTDSDFKKTQQKQQAAQTKFTSVFLERE